MSFYAAYHLDGRNKATHFVGVPAIVLSLLVPLSMFRVQVDDVVTFTGAMVAAGILILYYFFLDVWLALAMVLVMAGLIFVAQFIVSFGHPTGWAAFGALFVGGWVFQLVGHGFEGRKPALLNNLFQVFVAPIFLCAELFFALGYKKALHQRVLDRAMKLRAEAGIPVKPAVA